jgi:hypothetical protein
MSAAAAMRLTQLHGEPESTLAGPAPATARRAGTPMAWVHGLHEYGSAWYRDARICRRPGG